MNWFAVLLLLTAVSLTRQASLSTTQITSTPGNAGEDDEPGDTSETSGSASGEASGEETTITSEGSGQESSGSGYMHSTTPRVTTTEKQTTTTQMEPETTRKIDTGTTQLKTTDAQTTATTTDYNIETTQNTSTDKTRSSTIESELESESTTSTVSSDDITSTTVLQKSVSSTIGTTETTTDYTETTQNIVSDTTRRSTADSATSTSDDTTSTTVLPTSTDDEISSTMGTKKMNKAKTTKTSMTAMKIEDNAKKILSTLKIGVYNSQNICYEQYDNVKFTLPQLKDFDIGFDFGIIVMKHPAGVFTPLVEMRKDRIMLSKAYLTFNVPITCMYFASAPVGRYLIVGTIRNGKHMVDPRSYLIPYESNNIIKLMKYSIPWN